MNPVLVTGCGRSGTSLVSRLVVTALDLDNPEPSWTQGDQLNPDGYFETMPLISMNEALLCFNGYGYLKPPVWPLTIQQTEEAYRALGFGGDRTGQGGPFYKDPRLLPLQDWWCREFPSAVWLVVRRDPEDLVMRWQGVYGFTEKRAHRIVDNYERAIDKLLARTDVETWAVSYELLTDPATMVQEARRVCDLAGADGIPQGFLDTIRTRARSDA